MSERATWGAIGLVAGAIVGGLIGYNAGQKSAARDEDRPPIIVRGGSLHFETEKDWKPGNGNDWKLDHKNGKHVDSYQVTITPGADPCTANVHEGETVRVTYIENNESLTVDISREPDGQGKNEPAVKPSKPLKQDLNNPRLISYGTSNTGEISRIEILTGTTVVGGCSKPTGARILPIKK